MKLEFSKVAGPFRGRTGGMVWDGHRLLFSAVIEERILAFDPATGAVAEVRRYTGRTNGLALGADGILYGAQEGGRRIVRFMPDGSAAQTADLLDGKHHNQPTDLVIDSQARIWFTDPYNAIPPYGPRVFPFLDHQSILRLDPAGASWTVRRMTHDTRAPRAVALAGDTLFVADEGALVAYPILESGLGPRRVIDTRTYEGLWVEPDGTLLACGGAVLAGFSGKGDRIAAHALPVENAQRVARGGDALYLTSECGSLIRGSAARP